MIDPLAAQMGVLAAALVFDRLVGDPPWLWARISHPVVLFGRAIALGDRWFNREGSGPGTQRMAGALVIVALLALSALAGGVMHRLLFSLGAFGVLVEIVVVGVLLAQKSLADHVLAVVQGFARDGLAGGRAAVAMIVGRDPQTLDEAGVCRAAIESLAENFADGVIAPAFWYGVAGLPGILAYKMLNTADSMIGHKTPRYLHFGWASARLDDVANWLPARLSALLIAMAALMLRGREAGRLALSAALRDHGLHRSVNSGWPEAAMAGALDIQLAGPRLYRGERVAEPMMHGSGRGTARIADIRRGIDVFLQACSITALMAAALALLSVAS